MINSANNNSSPSQQESDIQNVGRRLEFMQLDEASLSQIRSLKNIVDHELPIGLDKFYEQLRKTPEVKRFFASDEHIARAQGAQEGHWGNISAANFNEEYVAKVQTIGSIHARIGLEPRWYIGGYAIILDHLINQAVQQTFPKSGMFAKRIMSAPEFGKALASLVKAALLDMDLAITVYIDEAEIAKQEAQSEAIATERKMVSDCFGKAMAAIAGKNLSYRITDDLPDAYHALRDDFNHALEELSLTVGDINSSAGQIHAGTEKIRMATDDLAKRTEQQAASLEQTAAALEEITTTVRDSSKRADEAGQLVAKTKAGAENSGQVVQQAVAAMEAIETSSKEINNIIGVIDEIAFQTNLLALNAGVEAARAGEAGKGFAVVAQEVRELAQRSAKAAKEIKELITTSDDKVKSGVALVAETGQALTKIVTEVSEIDRNIVSIVESSREQSTALGEINTAVNTMDQNTQQNADMVERTNASSHTLVQEVSRISKMLSEFNVGQTRVESKQHSPAKQSEGAEISVLKSSVENAYHSQEHTFVKKAAWAEL